MEQKKITQGYLLLALLVVGFVAYVTLTFNNTEQDSYQWDDIVQLNDNWIYEDELGNHSVIDLPIEEKTKAQTSYRLVNHLPKSWVEGSALCFKSDHLLVTVLVQGKEVYSLQVDKRSTIGKSPGFAYVFVPLTSDMFGKKIEIEYTTVYSGSSFHINKVILGEKSTIITGILRENAIDLFLAAFSLCLGVIFIITYMIKNKTYEMNKSLLYLGIFAIPLSVWSMTETQTLQFFLQNTYSIQYITYFALIMCPIPFLLYYNQQRGLSESLISKIISRVCLVTVMLCLILQAFGMVDLPDMLLFIHVCIILVVVYAFVYSIREFFLDRRIYRRMSYTTISMIIMLVCSIVDLYRYYYKENEDYSKYSRVGFLIYLGCTGLGMIFQSIQLDRTNKELEQLAYMDYETGVLNRSAFFKYVEEAVSPSLALVAVEVLELKSIISSFGTVGKDEVIKSTAKMIEVAFRNNGKIFRIAEAQFLIVLEAEVEKSYLHGIEILKKRVQNSNKSRGIKFYLGDSLIHYHKNGEFTLEMILEDLEGTLKLEKA